MAGELARLEQQAELSYDDELRVFRELGLGETGRLLEIGAGSGAVTRRLRTTMPGLQMVSLDIDETLLVHAAQPGVALVAGDAGQLPIADSVVDFVLLRYVLQHVPDVSRVLAEVGRVLRPGGRVVVVEVDSSCWGVADPIYPELAPVHAKVANAQRGAGGDRTIGRRLTRMLRAADFGDVTLRIFATSSDDRSIEDFALHLGPGRLAPLVASGALTFGDLALAADRWNKFRQDDSAWVMLVGFVAAGTAR